jgi:hypothetical protein
LVCQDETPFETRFSIMVKPGMPQYIDYDYKRNGVVNLLVLFTPLEARHHVLITDQ